jgi:hypothetical protein
VVFAKSIWKIKIVVIAPEKNAIITKRRPFRKTMIGFAGIVKDSKNQQDMTMLR